MKTGVDTGVAPQPEGPPSHPSWPLARTSHVLATAAIFAVLMFLSSMALDWILLYEHESRLVTIATSDALAGLIAGLLIFKLLSFERERRLRMEERLHTIGDMNHHIRNALQVIAFSVHSASNRKELEEITEAVNRIQWALREVLPKVEPSFEPFEGSARAKLPRD